MIESRAWVSPDLPDSVVYSFLMNSEEPLLAIVPKLSVISSLLMPIPESNIVNGLSFSFVYMLI